MAPQRRRSSLIALLTLCVPLVQREAPCANVSPPLYSVGRAKQRGQLVDVEVTGSGTGNRELRGSQSDPDSWSDVRRARASGAVNARCPGSKSSLQEAVPEKQRWKALLHNPGVWNDHRSSKARGQLNKNFPDFTDSSMLPANSLWLPGPRKQWLGWVLRELERLPASVFRNAVLWADFFQNPEEWVDYRQQKLNGGLHAKHPDFKRGQDPLWLNECPSPEKLPQMPRTLQANDDDSLLEELPQPPPKQAAEPETTMSEARLALWESVIEEPHNWVDRRGIKEVHSEPDFLHKTTRAALWLTETGIPDRIRKLVLEEREPQQEEEEVATPADFLESLERQWSVLVDEVRE